MWTMDPNDPGRDTSGQIPALGAADAFALRAWMARWALVRDAEAELLRRTPPDEKLRQLVAMSAGASLLGWDAAAEAETEAVRRTWTRLRECLRG